MKRLILWLIGLYQRWISPMLPPACRFVPSCSRYTAEAVQTHGALRGVALGVWRVCRCHPFSKGGYDPVPPTKSRREDFFCGSPVESGQAIMPPLAPDQGGKKEDSCFQP